MTNPRAIGLATREERQMSKIHRCIAVAMVFAVFAVVAGPASAHHREGHVGGQAATEPTPEPTPTAEPSPEPSPSPTPTAGLEEASDCLDRMSDVVTDYPVGVPVPLVRDTYISPFAPFSAITVALCLVQS